MPDIKDLQEKLGDHVYGLVNENFKSWNELKDSTQEDLEAIHGIGPSTAQDILGVIQEFKTVPQSTSEQTSLTVNREECLNRALALLVGCNRSEDVANLNQARSAKNADLDQILGRALSILEGLPGGDRGKNLANSVREMMVNS